MYGRSNRDNPRTPITCRRFIFAATLIVAACVPETLSEAITVLEDIAAPGRASDLKAATPAPTRLAVSIPNNNVPVDLYQPNIQLAAKISAECWQFPMRSGQRSWLPSIRALRVALIFLLVSAAITTQRRSPSSLPPGIFTSPAPKTGWQPSRILPPNNFSLKAISAGCRK